MTDERVDELRVHFLLDQEPRGRHADLTGIAEFRAGEQTARDFDIRVVEHDGRSVTAQFHGDALHVETGEGGELFADRGGAGERHFLYDRMRNEIFRDLGRD